LKRRSGSFDKHHWTCLAFGTATSCLRGISATAAISTRVALCHPESRHAGKESALRHSTPISPPPPCACVAVSSDRFIYSGCTYVILADPNRGLPQHRAYRSSSFLRRQESRIIRAYNPPFSPCAFLTNKGWQPQAKLGDGYPQQIINNQSPIVLSSQRRCRP
jgi:hypothetical protein